MRTALTRPPRLQFGVMLGNLGYHVMPDPFDNSSYWTNVVSQINSQLPGTVDGVHLQAYAGGGGNIRARDGILAAFRYFPAFGIKSTLQPGCIAL